MGLSKALREREEREQLPMLQLMQFKSVALREGWVWGTRRGQRRRQSQRQAWKLPSLRSMQAITAQGRPRGERRRRVTAGSSRCERLNVELKEEGWRRPKRKLKPFLFVNPGG